MTHNLPALLEHSPVTKGAFLFYRDDVFKSRGLEAGLTVGLSVYAAVREALRRSGHPLKAMHTATILVSTKNDAEPKQLDRNLWHTFIIEDGMHIQVFFAVRNGGGGGGKNPLATILSIVVIAAAMAVSWGAAGVLGPAFAAGTWGASALSTAIMIGGMMLVNMLAPPPKPKGISNDAMSTEKTYAISGTQNRFAPYERAPKVFGKMRFAPRLCANPYSFLDGDKQVVNYLYFVSLGRNKLSNFRIGDTDISQFQGVNLWSFENWQGEYLPFFDNKIYQEDLDINLKQGIQNTRTTGANTNQIHVELYYPTGCGWQDDDGFKTTTIAVLVEFCDAGQNNWWKYAHLKQTYSITERIAKPLRRGVVLYPPQSGRFDVRITKNSYDNYENPEKPHFVEVHWSALKSVQNGKAIRYTGTPYSLVVLSIQATDQLNGHVQEFNCTVESYCPVINNGTISQQPTNKPANLALMLATSNAIDKPVPLSMFNLQEWEKFQNWCNGMGFEFNTVVDSESQAKDILQPILSAGRGVFAFRDGKFSIGWDAPGKKPVYTFGMRNSWGFKSSKAFTREPIHALKYSFNNEEKDYQPDTMIVCADGYTEYTATNIVDAEAHGITKPWLIWVHARLRLADMIHKPELYEFFTDFQFFALGVGDCIAITHPVVLAGLAQARVIGTTVDIDGKVTHIEIDEHVTMNPSKQYGIVLFSGVGSNISYPIANTTTETTRVLQLGLPIPENSAPRVGDLISFGEAGKETTRLVVVGYDIGDDLTAKIFCQDIADRVYEAINGTMPPFDSSVTIPDRWSVNKPHIPQVTAIRTDEFVLRPIVGSGFIPRIQINFYQPEKEGIEVVRIEAYYRKKGDNAFTFGGSIIPNDGYIFIEGVEEKEEYDVRLCAISKNGIYSNYSQVCKTTVIGRTTPPPPPIRVFIEGTKLFWVMPENAPQDIVGWEVLIGMDAKDNIEYSKVITNPIVSEKHINIAEWSGNARRVYVRTVDDYGLKSTPVSVAVNLGDIQTDNVVWEVLESERSWCGKVINGTIHNDGLIANSPRHFMSKTTLFTSKHEPFLPSNGLSMQYMTKLIVPQEAIPSLLIVKPELSSGSIAYIEYGFNSAPEHFMSKSVHFTSRTSPFIPMKIEWLPLPDYLPIDSEQLIYFRFTTTAGVIARIEEIKFIFDVEDAQYSVSDFIIPAEGARLPIPPKYFRWIKNITFGLEFFEGSQAHSVVWSDRGVINSGFVEDGALVHCINMNGDFVNGKIDALIQGAKGV